MSPVNTADLSPGGGPNAPGGLNSFTAEGMRSAGTTGQAISPLYATSDRSLGFYQSANSFLALSYGTFVSQISVIGQLQASTVSIGSTANFNSGISVGSSNNTGSLIPAISSMSSLVGAFVVQGSSSSFTGIAWPAAQIGDIILVGLFKSGAASSMSSGLVPWSHVTVAGQIELRLSNVSTLVQNQSAQTFVFTRISPF